MSPDLNSFSVRLCVSVFIWRWELSTRTLLQYLITALLSILWKSVTSLLLLAPQLCWQGRRSLTQFDAFSLYRAVDGPHRHTKLQSDGELNYWSVRMSFVSVRNTSEDSWPVLLLWTRLRLSDSSISNIWLYLTPAAHPGFLSAPLLADLHWLPMAAWISFQNLIWFCRPQRRGSSSPGCSHWWLHDGGSSCQMLSELS